MRLTTLFARVRYVLCHFLVVAFATDVVVKVLLPMTGRHAWLGHHSVPAVSYAMEKINSRTDILRDVVLRMSTNDSACSGKVGTLAAIEAVRLEPPHVFIGPHCVQSLSMVARLALFWQIPVLTAGGMSPQFANHRDKYRMLTRVAGEMTTLVEFVAALLDRFNWQLSTTLYTGEPQWRHINDAVAHALEWRYRVARPKKFPQQQRFQSSSVHRARAGDMLKQASKYSRSE